MPYQFLSPLAAMRRSRFSALLCASLSCMMLVGCIDDSYDLDKVDLTMGLGSDGLKVKLGSTEKIFLKDIIDTDGNTKLDSENRFYLTEQGSTELSYTVQAVNSTVDACAQVTCKQRVLEWDEDFLQQMGKTGVDHVQVPAGLLVYGTAEGENKADFRTGGIGEEVKSINRVYPRDFGATLHVDVIRSQGVALALDRLEDFTLTLPRYVHLRDVPKGWTLDGQKLMYKGELAFAGDGMDICSVAVDYIDLGDEGIPSDGSIVLSQQMTRVAMHGTAYFKSTRDFVMKQGEYADIVLSIRFTNNGAIRVDSIRGMFDPKINPELTPIRISDNLPDFLRDEATKVKVYNPTLKFVADMRALPADVNLSANLTSVKDGSQGWQQSVALPQVTMKGAARNVAYYHGGGSEPYDPDADVNGSIINKVDNLGTLIERLPDRIDVDLDGGRVALKQQEATMRMGYTYRAKASYSVYVPLEIEEGFCVVYRDSSESVSDDLKDYSAKGMRLNTTIENTVPMALELQIVACGKDGKPVPGVTFDKVTAKAGLGEKEKPVTTDVQMDGDLADPKSLKRIDYFVFVVTARAADGSQAQGLTSGQYVRLADMRLRLKGAVTADLN